GQFVLPEILENPTDVLVPRNEPATLNCHASGMPTPNITWYKDGQPFDHTSTGRNVLLETGDLFFLRVLQTKRDNDAGVYWCVAANSLGKAISRNATLEITILREDYLTEPTDTRLAEGETALLACVPPRGYPEPVVTWQKDNQDIDPSREMRYRIVDGGSLVITGVRATDQGTYVCLARNVYGERRSRQAALTVLVSPHLVYSSGTLKEDEGGTVELVCRVGGDPPPEVFWHRVQPSRNLPLARMKLLDRSQVLKIQAVTHEDEGIYACHAESPVGAVSANITLTVNSHPSISVKPSDTRVGEGSSALFECSVTGSPKPTSYWTREGSGVLIGVGQTGFNGRMSVDEHNTLTIREVNRRDQGYYVCSAVSEIGSVLTRVYLEVQSVRDLPPPIIALAAPNQTLQVGTEGIMPCEAQGMPEPRVIWQRDGQLLHSNIRLTITPLGTLRIKSLRITDTDVYTCTASSETGETTWTTALAVAKPTNTNVAFFKMPDINSLPSPPKHVEILEINATSVMLGWKHGQLGYSNPLGYTVQLWSPDIRGPWRVAQTEQTPTSTYTPTPVALTVTRLQTETRYVFVVRSRNSNGISRPSPVTRTVQTLTSSSKILVPLYEVRTQLSNKVIELMNVKPLSESAIKVEWNLLTHESLIEGIYLYYRLVDSKNNINSGTLSMERVLLHSIYIAPPTSHIISGLLPSSTYEFFLVPFYHSVEGHATSVMNASTLEVAPAVPPTDLRYIRVNETAIRIIWNPVSNPIESVSSNPYIVLVYEGETTKQEVFNITVSDAWVLLSDLLPGITYSVQIRTVTSKGPGKLSEPIQFSIPDVGEASRVTPFPPVTVPPMTNNTYLILYVCTAAVFIFLLMGVIVFYIYRKHMGEKCPHYYSKSNDGLWSEYPGCWTDASHTSAITSTLYTDLSTNGKPITQLCQRPPAKIPTKSEYERRICDRVYEDPDVLNLTSLNRSYEKRYFSTEPYATTPLISDMFRRPSGNCLPPNIPLSSSKSSGLGNILIEAQSEQGGVAYNTQSSNINSHTEKGPFLQFPPPPKNENDYSDTNTLTSYGSRRQARLLSKQLPYGGSSSVSSHRSLESQMLSASPRYIKRVSPSPHATHKDYDNKIYINQHIKKPSTGSEKDYETQIVENPQYNHSNEDEVHYAQSLLNGRVSPESSSIIYNYAQSERSHYLATSFEDNIPLEDSYNVKFMKSANGEVKWTRGGSVCSTDESIYAPPEVMKHKPSHKRNHYSKKDIKKCLGSNISLSSPVV
ncbi:unnamed protein product, partial [Meganyctiphanes norvegica]